MLDTLDPAGRRARRPRAVTGARRAAAVLRGHPVVHVLARAGFAANGVVHALIGVLVVAVAVGGRGEADQVGALRAVAAAPWGTPVVWAVAIGLWGLAAWHLAAGAAARGDGRWGRRLAEWGQTVVFAAIGAVAASVALGAKPDADGSARVASRGLLGVPGGPYLLAAIGIGFAAAATVFVVMGARRSFEKLMSIPRSRLGALVRSLGVAGFIAKGVALGILGVLLLVAASRADATRAGGLDSAVDGLLTLPAGRGIAVALGIGLVAYGVFCSFRARYARL